MTASLSGLFNLQVETDTGAPAALFRLYTYAAGTTTHKAAYTDAAASVPHTYTSDGVGGQYIGLDARGELPAPLFLTSGGYDLALKTPGGATVWTRRAYAIDELSAALRQDLAAAGDVSKAATLVGFTLNAVGAAARNLYARANDLVFLTDFTGVDATGVADCSTALQAALTATRQNGAPVNAGKTLVWCKGTYKCSAGLVIGTGQRVLFEPGVTIDASGLPNETTSLFSISNQAQVYLDGNGALLKGARATAAAGTEGNSAAFYVYGTDNFEIANFRIQDFATDGITITGDNTTSGPCTSGVVRNCYATNNRRNGMSIISVKGLTVIGGEYTNSNGGTFGGPWNGIDIEPNSDCYLQGVTLLNVRTSGNVGGGIACVPGPLSAVGAASNLFEVAIIGGRSYQDGDLNATNRPGLAFLNGGALTNQVFGQITVRGYVVDSPSGRGVGFYNWDADKCPRVVLDDCMVFDPDYTLSAATNANRTGFVAFCDSGQAITALGNIIMRNCQAIDRRGSARMVWGFLLAADATKSLKNIRVENPTSVNFTSASKYDVNCDAANVTGGMTDVDVTYTTPKPATLATASIFGWVGKRIQSATNGNAFTLPLAANCKGASYEVEVLAGVTGTTVVASGADTIKFNGAAAAGTLAVAAGDCVRLRSKGGALWMAAPTA
jgi:hypothetical protein